MNREDARPKYPKSLDRVASPVQDHVGGVEIDADVGAVDVNQELQQVFGSLLAGFEGDRLAMGRGMVGNLAGDLTDCDVVGIGGIGGHHAHVHPDPRNRKFRGHVTDGQHAGNAFGTEARGDEPDGVLYGGNISVVLAIEGRDGRVEDEAGASDGFAPRLHGGIKVQISWKSELAAAEAERGEFRKRVVGVATGPEHRAGFQICQGC